MQSSSNRSARTAFAAAIVGAALLAGAGSALGEVRLGRNVQIGGHDFSNQTYHRKKRLVVHLYDRTPRNAGCRWQADRAGGRVKVCHLRRK